MCHIPLVLGATGFSFWLSKSGRGIRSIFLLLGGSLAGWVFTYWNGEASGFGPCWHIPNSRSSSLLLRGRLCRFSAGFFLAGSVSGFPWRCASWRRANVQSFFASFGGCSSRRLGRGGTPGDDASWGSFLTRMTTGGLAGKTGQDGERGEGPHWSIVLMFGLPLFLTADGVRGNERQRFRLYHRIFRRGCGPLVFCSKQLRTGSASMMRS
ncbi:hypothetical protein QBC39DRAFT_102667 [Podospora conica]|nr:hypothetical protein QBC39DRAFT_102667 [Schizothecium conicum]